MIEATGKAAEKLVSGFAGSPAMLLVLCLNVAMIGMFGYGLLKIVEISGEGRTQIMSALQACIAGGSDHGISRKE
jgi:hypothetical protein